MSIQEKLSKAQLMLKVPKNQYNAFGKYAYRNCEDIYNAAKPVVNSLGCVLTVSDSIEETPSGRTFVRATATLTDIEDGTSIEVSGYAEIAKEKKGTDQAQLTGSSSSYARKYCLCGMFLLDGEKDPDATNTSGAILCDHCNNEIEPYAGKNGVEVTPAQHANASRKKFGKVLCLKCIEEINAESNS